VKQLVGIDGNNGKQIGLTNDWGARTVKLVGDYEEMFERNLGTRLQAIHFFSYT
jgi:general L-amino acid transport system substrate-binding protein